MKTSLALCYLMTALHSIAAVFSPPEGWVDLQLKSPDPSKIADAVGYSSPDGFTRVVIYQSVRPISTAKEADDMIQGISEAARRSGDKIMSHEETLFGAFHARYIRGELTDPTSAKNYRLDNYLVFTSSTIVIIMLMVDSQHEGRIGVEWLLPRLEIPGDPVLLNKAAMPTELPDGPTIVDDSFSYHLGKQLALFAVGVVVITLIIVFMIRRNNRDPRSKAVRVHKSRQYNHDDPY